MRLLPDHNNGILISAVGTPPAQAGLHTQQRRADFLKIRTGGK
jgi:hypothetical protein